jgi:hypothetical protein
MLIPRRILAIRAAAATIFDLRKIDARGESVVWDEAHELNAGVPAPMHQKVQAVPTEGSYVTGIILREKEKAKGWAFKKKAVPA